MTRHTTDSPTIRIDTAVVRQMARVLLEKSSVAKGLIQDCDVEAQRTQAAADRLRTWSDKIANCDDAAIQLQYAVATERTDALLAAVRARLADLHNEVAEATAALQPLAAACLAAHGMAIGKVDKDARGMAFVVDGVAFRIGDAGVELEIKATKHKLPRKPLLFRLPLKEGAS